MILMDFLLLFQYIRSEIIYFSSWNNSYFIYFITYFRLNGPTILRKGKIDTIIDEYGIILVDLEERLESLRMKEKEGKCEKMSKLKGNGRRCGGQGDLLTGTLAAFTFWALKMYVK